MHAMAVCAELTAHVLQLRASGAAQNFELLTKRVPTGTRVTISKASRVYFKAGAFDAGEFAL
eukprot:13876950-Alexandrium_andersonii.AAC.1